MAETSRQSHELPVRTHIYQNHHFDSLRWNFVTLRKDDIVIATSYKAGTTWMQGIVGNVIFSGQELPAPLHMLSPWLDVRRMPLELVLTGLERQANRRFIKTHLPLDGLRYDPRVKYIYVGRDARDVFMSLWNHYRSYTEAAFIGFNSTPGRVGPELPRCPDDIHEGWHNWITRGWFEWETEGYPFWRTCIMCSRGGTIVTCRISSSYTMRTCWPILKARSGASPTFLESRCPWQRCPRFFVTAPSRR
jgi:aryl sulfotransferase